MNLIVSCDFLLIQLFSLDGEIKIIDLCILQILENIFSQTACFLLCIRRIRSLICFCLLRVLCRLLFGRIALLRRRLAFRAFCCVALYRPAAAAPR